MDNCKHCGRFVPRRKMSFAAHDLCEKCNKGNAVFLKETNTFKSDEWLWTDPKAIKQK